MAHSLFQYEKIRNNNTYNSRVSTMTAGLISAQQFGIKISEYNQLYNNSVARLQEERKEIADALAQKLRVDENYTGMRSDGVKLAWKYEKADVELGGRGSARWNKAERQEILEKDSVRGAEGHHGKNVANHPESQADPDNIKFYKSRQEHLDEGHNGSWRNSSNMEELDKEAMLRRTHTRGVIKNELQGAALSAAIAFGLGASIEVISTLAREGISVYTVREAFKNGLEVGIKCAVSAVTIYSVSRTIQTVLQKVTSMSETWAGGTASAVISAVFAAIEYYSLRKAGLSAIDAVKKAGGSMAIRMAILAIQFIPYCGQYLSFAANVAYALYGVGRRITDVKFEKELEMRKAEWSLPVFA